MWGDDVPPLKDGIVKIFMLENATDERYFFDMQYDVVLPYWTTVSFYKELNKY